MLSICVKKMNISLYFVLKCLQINTSTLKIKCQSDRILFVTTEPNMPGV